MGHFQPYFAKHDFWTSNSHFAGAPSKMRTAILDKGMWARQFGHGNVDKGTWTKELRCSSVLRGSQVFQPRSPGNPSLRQELF
jgi:hypothetical protein